jgi:hypothetical protein
MSKAGPVLVPLLILLAGMPAAPVRADRPPSTPRERAKAVKLARQLETEPSGKKARDARKWLALWLVEVPDYQFQYCPQILGGTPQERQRLPAEVLAQTTYSSLAFALENAGKDLPALDAYRAGVLGALRSYEAILAKDPGARSPLLDDLVAKRNAETLDAYLAETVKSCPVKPSPPAPLPASHPPNRERGNK